MNQLGEDVIEKIERFGRDYMTPISNLMSTIDYAYKSKSLLKVALKLPLPFAPELKTVDDVCNEIELLAGTFFELELMRDAYWYVKSGCDLPYYLRQIPAEQLSEWLQHSPKSLILTVTEQMRRPAIEIGKQASYLYQAMPSDAFIEKTPNSQLTLADFTIRLMTETINLLDTLLIWEERAETLP